MHLPSLHPHPLALPWALTLLPLGFGLGCAYFAALHRGVDRLVGGRPGALALLLLRLASAALLLAAAARWGAVALLAMFGGFLLARPVALRVAARTRSATRVP